MWWNGAIPVTWASMWAAATLWEDELMIQSTNFPLSKYCLKAYGSWDKLEEQVKALNLDGPFSLSASSSTAFFVLP